MAKPNYSFEKRQRELKKAAQQEEKRLKKLASRQDGEGAGTASADDTNDTEDSNPTKENAA